ncbi:MAG: ATP-binding protein [Lachnospiraceae bacterium]|nr:ATP-binding protein [Lachnospiraceae bacterium]
MAKKRKEKQNEGLLNVIAPVGIEFQANGFTLGDNLCKAYGIIKYPPEPDYGWLSRITNAPSTMISFTFTPNSGEIIESLNKNIRMLENEAASAKDHLKEQRSRKGADDGMKLLKQIDENGEIVGELAGTLIPLSTDKEMLKKIEQKTRGVCAMANCKIRPLSFMQKHALKHVAPFYIDDTLYQEVSNRVMPLRTFVGGFPFSSSGYNDNQGFYVGKDVQGGLVILDFWKRENDRTNSNIVIMGVPGTGKSASVKHISLSEYMMGTKLIFIDPESEYKDFCKNLGGTWINAGGSDKGRVNPLHIMPIPKNEEIEEADINNYYDIDDGNGLGDLALYLKHLEIFFSLYIPDLSTKEKAILKKTLIELYRDFDITWNIDATKIQAKDYPILSDLQTKLKEKAEELEKTRKESDTNPYADLVLYLEDAANGADASLWNGPTTLDADGQINVLDTFSLQTTSDNVKRAQYFLLQTWAWNVMSKDRSEKVLLICDESYLMIDPNVPQSLVFLRNVAKRDRKYEAGLIIISHSVVDFLDEKVKMYGQALLDTPCYKILFGTDGKNLEETDNLYNLTEAEKELLESKRRGHALFMIGSKRLHVNFEIPDYKWEYFGSAGGR